MYFVLAAVGLFTLLVGASVRLRRPRDQATLHFFWLCVAFFGAFTFSFNGPFDRLDWVFYWGDAIAFALLPPLLLHFTLVFPERPVSDPQSRAPERLVQHLVPLMYLPALILARRRVVAVARASDGSLSGPLFSRLLDVLDRAEPAYLFVCALAALVVVCSRVPRDYVGDRAPPAALDCLGHGARRRPVRVRLRAAVGVRHQSAAGAAADGAFRSASCR